MTDRISLLVPKGNSRIVNENIQVSYLKSVLNLQKCNTLYFFLKSTTTLTLKLYTIPFKERYIDWVILKSTDAFC